MRGRSHGGKHVNLGRAALLAEAIELALAKPGFAPLDALLLPGGYFRLSSSIRDLGYDARAEQIAATGVGRVCSAAARRLDASCPGALLIVGIDTRQPRRHPDHGDQLCVAFGRHGIAGIGRKIFPTALDTSGAEQRPLICHAGDYTAPQRIVQLANGSRAALCACYDLFGVADAGLDQPTARGHHIRYLADGSGHLRQAGEPGFAELRAALIRHWGELLARQKVDVALAAIHSFTRPGRDLYWQRHGLAAASAAMQGGLALGAAFFRKALPGSQRSPLAAARVPREHLGQGLQRRAHRLLPEAELVIGGRQDGARALVRLFVPPA